MGAGVFAGVFGVGREGREKVDNGTSGEGGKGKVEGRWMRYLEDFRCGRAPIAFLSTY